MTKRDMKNVRELIETRGVRAAAAALIEVCEDRKSPAPARAAAGTSLFRAAGMFDRARHDEDEKPLSEIDGHELRRRIAEAEADLAERTKSRLEIVDLDGGDDDEIDDDEGEEDDEEGDEDDLFE